MKPTIREIRSYINSIAPPSYQESYDNAQLITGDPREEVLGVLLCLDSLENIIEEAIQKKCNLVIAHHPIVFQGLKSLTGNNYVERVIIKAIKNDIAILAVHTNLDNMRFNGVNTKIAEKLKLKNTRILAPKKKQLFKLYTYVPTTHIEEVRNELFKYGAGDIGAYSECSFTTKGIGSFKGNQTTNPFVGKVGERHSESEYKLEVLFPAHLQGGIVQALNKAHPYEVVAYDIVALENSYQDIGAGIIGELERPIPSATFLKGLKTSMNTACVRYTNLCKPMIKTVAVCGGAGSFLLKKAKSAGADVFVTADFKYHEFFDADNQIIIADIGHYESEQFTIELFYELLTQKFTNFTVYCTEINTNPINYL